MAAEVSGESGVVAAERSAWRYSHAWKALRHRNFKLFVGMAPFGSLLAGGLAHLLGAQHTVMITGACCVLGALWFTFELPAVRRAMRPIYVEMGILPGVEEQARG